MTAAIPSASRHHWCSEIDLLPSMATHFQGSAPAGFLRSEIEPVGGPTAQHIKSSPPAALLVRAFKTSEMAALAARLLRRFGAADRIVPRNFSASPAIRRTTAVFLLNWAGFGVCVATRCSALWRSSAAADEHVLEST